MKATVDLSDALESLFNGDDLYTLLTDDSVYGAEGLSGLRLIGNCLYAARETLETAETGGSPSAGLDVDQPRHARLAKVETQIRELSLNNSTHFVLAYHIHDTDAWKLAWSQDLRAWEAIDEMLAFVRCGLSLDLQAD